METPDEDPRGKDVAEGGYPEEQEPGADPSGGGTRRREEHGGGAPGTSSPEESEPDTATGNPDAAGG